MKEHASNIQKNKIPSYELYGDYSLNKWELSFHIERIPLRSSIYNWNISPHLHEAFIQILLITEGEGKVLVDNKWWPVRAPALLSIPAFYVHGYKWQPSIDGLVITAAQKPLEALAQLLYPHLLHTIKTPLVTNLSPNHTELEGLHSLMLLVEKEARVAKSGQDSYGLSLINAMLILMERIASQEQPPVTDRTVYARKNELLQRFRQLIDNEYASHKPLHFYADELGITTGHLNRLCKEELGFTALKMIHTRLIHEAERDLIYTNSSVRQVAQSLGFQDEAYFSRFFKRHTHQTPNRFRHEARNQLQNP